MEASDEIQQLKQLLEIDSEMKKGEKKKKKKERQPRTYVYWPLFLFSFGILKSALPDVPFSSP